jgi:isopenicillin N synthase-like dioxygenase
MSLGPAIAVDHLAVGPSRLRDRADDVLRSAAESIGVLRLRTTAGWLPTADTRDRLLDVFGLPAEQQQALWRQRWAPDHPNVYRGWNPSGPDTAVDIYDLGLDICGEGRCYDASDPLQERTPVPDDRWLPGWHTTAEAYTRAMERVGSLLMQSFARSFGLAETHFDDAFTNGISTLRIMRYQWRDTTHASPRRGEHVDSGFVTLLAQCDAAGLEVQRRDGEWIDVAPDRDELVVNFGAVLERWTGGRVRATPHRVVSRSPVRHSIPFFYEPRADAVIAPLPGVGPSFEPFSYGDHLWERMVRFPNFHGLEQRRTPRGLPGT